MGQPGTPDNVSSPSAVYILIRVTRCWEPWHSLCCPRMSGLLKESLSQHSFTFCLVLDLSMNHTQFPLVSMRWDSGLIFMLSKNTLKSSISSFTDIKWHSLQLAGRTLFCTIFIRDSSLLSEGWVAFSNSWPVFSAFSKLEQTNSLQSLSLVTQLPLEN